ncbi:hypothetical protein [Robbsia sp. KACC 23696]|uniref:hypothetical protein n=1 Tax=Robbsia sp. KACC 23696 TaxID=3149231 RepID=UPI00325B1B72
MNEIANAAASCVGPMSVRSNARPAYPGGPHAEDPAAYRADATRAASRQWHDALQTAEREGWSIAPRAMACADVGAGIPLASQASRSASSPAPGSAPGVPSAEHAGRPPDSLPVVAAFLARSRRGLGASREAAPQPALQPDGHPRADDDSVPEVVSEPVPRQWRVRTHHTLAEATRALSSCSAPFSHASQLADDLFAASDNPAFTAERRETLRDTAVVADRVSGMAPSVFYLQSICKMFGIAANLLEGKPMTPNDVLDINILSRSLVSIERMAVPLHARETALPEAAKARESAVDPFPGGGFARSGPDASKMAPLPAARDVDFDLEETALTSLDLFYQEPGDVLSGAPADGVDADPRADGALDRAAAGGTSPIEQAAAGPSPVGSVEEIPRGAAPPVIAPAPLDAEDAAMQQIASVIRPASLQWTKVQTVPVRRTSGPQPQWETFALAEYAASRIDVTGRADGERFVVEGHTYVYLDGHALAVRELLPGLWWVVDNHHRPMGAGGAAHRLPPLPLRARGLRLTVVRPHWEDVPDVHDAAVGVDGYIRHHGRKFVEIDGMRVEASLRRIDGEHVISDFARPLPDMVVGSDAMQIITSSDGSRWIEGEYGYYRLRYDLRLREFYVTEPGDIGPDAAPRRALVDFDARRHRWTALVGRRHSGYEDMLAVGYRQMAEQLEGDVEARGSAIEAIEPSEPGGAAAREEEAGMTSGTQALQAGRAPLSEPSGLSPSSPLERGDSADVDEFDDSVSDSRETSVSSGNTDESGSSPPFPLYASRETGLEREFALFGHYAENLKRFPFFTRRHPGESLRPRNRLRHGLRLTFERLRATSMVAVNRMEPEIRAAMVPKVLSLRHRLRDLYPSAKQWYGMTLMEKQREVAHMIRVAYKEAAGDMWPCLSGYCNEIADVVLSGLINIKPKLRSHLMELALYDRRGVKGTHVMLVYAERPVTLRAFVDLASRDVQVQHTRPTFSEAEFYDWLLTNKESVLLIDAWATGKLLDLSGATSADMVRNELLPNLQEAGFELKDSPQFQVRAVLPQRPHNAAGRPRREPDGMRALTSVPASWELFAGWAVSGRLPAGTSAAALGADLAAAAASPTVDVGRQTLLRRLAEEIMPVSRNGTAALGIDRRTLTMAGRAALALLDIPRLPVVAADGGTTASAAYATEAGVTEVAMTDASVNEDADPGTSAATATRTPSDTTEGRMLTPDARLSAYRSMVPSDDDHSMVKALGANSYVWMPDGLYYAVREIMPGRLFIVDPNDSPFGRPALPSIPLERDGAVWRVAGGHHRGAGMP